MENKPTIALYVYKENEQVCRLELQWPNLPRKGDEIKIESEDKEEAFRSTYVVTRVQWEIKKHETLGLCTTILVLAEKNYTTMLQLNPCPHVKRVPLAEFAALVTHEIEEPKIQWKRKEYGPPAFLKAFKPTDTTRHGLYFNHPIETVALPNCPSCGSEKTVGMATNKQSILSCLDCHKIFGPNPSPNNINKKPA